MLGRIVRPADFERLLATAPQARSAHFAAHHLPARPSPAGAARPRATAPKLSTEAAPVCPQAVDEPPRLAPDRVWLGVAVPKRHAREATTRNLIRRQIRAVVGEREPAMARGLWLVRLRSAFDRRQFRSPTSADLRLAARDELAALLQRACDRVPV